MKKILSHSIIFILCCFVAFNSQAQSEKSRVLSYSQWIDEMAACTDSVYELRNALIRPVLKTDTVNRTIEIQAKVLISNVEFEGYSEKDMLSLPDWVDNSAELKNLTFQKDFTLKHCKGTLPIIFSGKFQGDLNIEDIKSQNIWAIYNVKCSGQVSLTDINPKSFSFNYNQVFGALLIENINCKEVLLYRDSIYGPTKIDKVIGVSLNLYNSQFQIQHPNIEKQESPLTITHCDLDKVAIAHNHIGQTYNNQFVEFSTNKISEYFGIWDSEIQPITVIRTLRLSSGRLVLGEDMTWGEALALHNVEYNKFSYFDWPPLKGKIFSYNHIRLGNSNALEGKVYKGETYDELEDTYLFDRLILAKQHIRNNYLQNGFKKNANEILIEIRDLETRMWAHEYQKNKSLESYFHWKMNVFLRKFSAYGTNPVIAIIYSLKVILFFALIYLFFHNDWDIGSRKIIGKRLRFILTYFQVNKGLSELDQEQQLESRNEVVLLASENEVSTGKIPFFFTRLINWYVKSNLISDSLRKFALRKMDILSGTFSNLPKKQQRKVAVLSGAWFMGFLLYTVLLKVLNALTLSLNAFTTLGFGNIPTKGFSRYIVIVQGFIGWVLMTVFSVTLITQLLQ